MGLIQHQNYPYFSEKIMNHSPLGRHTQLLLVLAVALCLEQVLAFTFGRKR